MSSPLESKVTGAVLGVLRTAEDENNELERLTSIDQVLTAVMLYGGSYKYSQPLEYTPYARNKFACL